MRTLTFSLAPLFLAAVSLAGPNIGVEHSARSAPTVSSWASVLHASFHGLVEELALADSSDGLRSMFRKIVQIEPKGPESSSLIPLVTELNRLAGGPERFAGFSEPVRAGILLASLSEAAESQRARVAQWHGRLMVDIPANAACFRKATEELGTIIGPNAIYLSDEDLKTARADQHKAREAWERLTRQEIEKSADETLQALGIQSAQKASPSYRGVPKEHVIASLARAASLLHHSQLGPATENALAQWRQAGALEAIAGASNDVSLAQSMRSGGYLVRRFEPVFRHWAAEHSWAGELYRDLAAWGAWNGVELSGDRPVDQEMGAHLLGAYLRRASPTVAAVNRTSPDPKDRAWLLRVVPLALQSASVGQEAVWRFFGLLNFRARSLLLRAARNMSGTKAVEDSIIAPSPIERFGIAVADTPQAFGRRRSELDALYERAERPLAPFFERDEVLQAGSGYIDDDRRSLGFVFSGTRRAAEALAAALPDVFVIDARGTRVMPARRGPSSAASVLPVLPIGSTTFFFSSPLGIPTLLFVAAAILSMIINLGTQDRPWRAVLHMQSGGVQTAALLATLAAALGFGATGHFALAPLAIASSAVGYVVAGGIWNLFARRDRLSLSWMPALLVAFVAACLLALGGVGGAMGIIFSTTAAFYVAALFLKGFF